MRPEDVPPGALLLDTDVVSWIALREGRWEEFASLLVGHPLFVSYVTVAEVGSLLRMRALSAERSEALSDSLSSYPILEINLDDVVREWSVLRSATARVGAVDDRERRQNDTWIAACARSVDPALPVVTGNIRDFRVLAEASGLVIVHPDLDPPAEVKRGEDSDGATAE